jgi:mRNA interferase MazF
MKRGEIYWCDLDPRRGHQQAERRPVIIVSADPYNDSRSPSIGIAPLTKSIAKNPLHLKLGKDETGLAADSMVDHAQFLDRTRLRPEAAGRLTPASQARLDHHLARVLGL